MKVTVTKITDESLLRKSNRYSSNKESTMTLATAYKNGHTNIRTQLFVVELEDIPLYVASQLVRQTQGVNWFQRSKRTDRGGKDFKEECRALSLQIWKDRGNVEELHMLLYDLENFFPYNFDRCAPTSLMGILNAEALMNMGHKRLCYKASSGTGLVVASIRDEVRAVDPDLAKHMVPQCIYRGGICPEPKGCGWNENEVALNHYKKLFE